MKTILMIKWNLTDTKFSLRHWSENLPKVMKTAILTSIALLAFAANAVICRMALAGGSIDPISFTSLRIVSGAVALLLVSLRFKKMEPPPPASWKGILSLFIYAITFSIGYVSINSGTGALILFGAVQLTMHAVAFRAGERPTFIQWAGLIIAGAGLIYLLSPGLSAPDPIGAILMALSGIAWGIYTLAGKGATHPVALTKGNFLRAAPIALVVSLLTFSQMDISVKGALLAITSGALTSGIGYIIWYQALPRLSTTQAAVLQLLVPIITAVGGVIFISEPLSWRLTTSSVLVLGGVCLSVIAKKKVRRFVQK